MECPICGRKIEDYSTDYMEHILMEESARCEDEHHFYYYEFLTGSELEVIGDAEFRRYYTDSRSKMRIQNKKFKEKLKIEKERYRNTKHK